MRTKAYISSHRRIVKRIHSFNSEQIEILLYFMQYPPREEITTFLIFQYVSGL